MTWLKQPKQLEIYGEGPCQVIRPTADIMLGMTWRSTGKPTTRWSGDQVKFAGTRWERMAHDRFAWRTVMEAYVQQWSGRLFGDMMITMSCSKKPLRRCSYLTLPPSRSDERKWIVAVDRLGWLLSSPKIMQIDCMITYSMFYFW